MFRRVLLLASVAILTFPAVAQPVSPLAAPMAGGPASMPAPVIDTAAREDVISNLGTALRQRYVFPNVGEQAASRIDAALAAGEYDGLSDPAAFAARLDADVAGIARDKHLRIVSMNGPPPPPPAGMVAMPRSEAGIVRADQLAGGVGYLEVVAFPRHADFKPVIDRAMGSLSGSRALIIDLRRNIGGAPEGVAYLVSFLLPPGQPVHINDTVTRVAGTDDFTRESFFSQPTPTSFAGRPVYVLTSPTTFSGGEEFAYDVQALDLGLIVGEATAGGAHPTGPAPLGNGLMAMMPFARAENARTKTNWEGGGVEPDIEAPAADALKIALERLGVEAVSDIASATRQQVFAPRTASLPGSEAALLRVLAGVTREPVDLTALGAEQVEMLRPQLPQLQAQLRALGAIKSIEFVGPGMAFGDEFNVVFANGVLGMTIVAGPDGLVNGWAIRMGPPAAPGG